MTISSNGGQPRELPAWARMRSDLVAQGRMDIRQSLPPLPDASKKSEATNAEEWEWFAFPVDGGNPVATGAGDALRAAGIAAAAPILMTGDRVLFAGGTRGAV